MRETIVERIESFFGMNFSDVIQKLHWDEKVSLKEISERSGVIRQSIMYECKKRGLKLRSIQDATKLTKNKGEAHWAWALRKENDPRIRAHSKRMKKNNPSKSLESRRKMSRSISETFLENALPQEKAFRLFLDLMSISYIEQYPIESFIIDFFIPKLNLCVEVDSDRRWGHHKRGKARLKDESLMRSGFRVLRLSKEWALEFSRIAEILLADKLVSK